MNRKDIVHIAGLSNASEAVKLFKNPGFFACKCLMIRERKLPNSIISQLLSLGLASGAAPGLSPARAALKGGATKPRLRQYRPDIIVLDNTPALC